MADILKVRINGGWESIPAIQGKGVNHGGTTGQILTKKSNADYDTEWATPPVQSVNGKTGVVVLGANDVQALPIGYHDPAKANLADFNAHISNSNNPHGVTKAQVGLSNVQNKIMDATPTDNSQNYVTSGGVKSYVDAHGGKIDSITVNGESQALPISNKNVTIPKVTQNNTTIPLMNNAFNVTVPTKTSDLTNDSDFATTQNVSTAVQAEAALRAAADSALDNQINNEGTARSNADTILQGNIDSEAATRLTQDNLRVLISSIVNNTSTTTTNAPLSANMGKELQDQINNLKAIGRYLSLWDCATGLPATDPTVSPYTYKTGDYFIVNAVSSATPAVNYKPNGSTYTSRVASTTQETQTVLINDYYIYDGTLWRLVTNTQRTVTFENVAGNPYDNVNLASALNSKVTSNSVITGATHTKVTYDTKGLVTGGSDLSASDIPNLTLNKISDVTATASEVNVLDGITATTQELNYTDGVTSNIQTQLNNKSKVTISETGTSTTKAKYITVDNTEYKVSGDDVADVKVDGNSIVSNKIASLSTSSAHPYSAQNPLATLDDVSASGGGTVTSITAGTGLTGGTITASGTIAVDTAVIATKSDLTGKQDNLNSTNAGDNVTITQTSGQPVKINALTGLTATVAELNYSDGVTSNIQTQLNSKQSTIDSSHKLSSDLVDDTNHTNRFVTASEKTSIGTALQPNDNISELINDSGYITLSQVPTEIFWCTYEVTPFADIAAAITAGKLPVCIDATRLLPCAYQGSTSIYFGSIYSGKNSRYVTVTNTNAWSHGSKTLEEIGNKVTTISSSSTDTEYPSAKCVYDATEDIREVAAGKTKSYVVSTAHNAVLNSQDASVTLTSALILQDGTTSVPLSNLKKGDNIYIIETDVPDRWIAVESSSAVQVYKLETAKVPVTDVKINNTSIVSNTIANITGENLPSHALSKISDVTATASEVNILDGATVTTTELNYLDGVTSNIQTQLDNKASTSQLDDVIQTLMAYVDSKIDGAMNQQY